MNQSTKGNTSKTWAAKLAGGFIACCISVMICLAVLELLTRFVYTRKLDYQIEMSRYAALMKSRVGDGELSHQHVPGTEAVLMGVPVSINSHGFRDDEVAVNKEPGTYRIMLLGDSLTFGWGAHKEALFANQLEEKLNNAVQNQKVEVINTGIGNYNTEQEAIFFERHGYKFNPDMILLNYFINDAELTPQKKSPWLLKYSYFGMWLWGRLDTLKRMSGKGASYFDYYTDLYSEESPGWQNVQKAFGSLADYSKKNKIQFVVSILPELHAVGETYAFSAIHDKVKTAALEAGADEVVDLAEAFKREEPESLWVSPDDAHPNDYAHGIIAEGLFRHLIQNKALKGDESESTD